MGRKCRLEDIDRRTGDVDPETETLMRSATIRTLLPVPHDDETSGNKHADILSCSLQDATDYKGQTARCSVRRYQ